MSRPKTELDNLRTKDIYSLILFALFKLKDLPEYSALSELAYILDKENLLKLCEFFGGMTITIPTMQELESIVYSLVLYQYVNIDGMDYNDAVQLLGKKSCDLRTVKSAYVKLVAILDKYDFNKRCENA